MQKCFDNRGFAVACGTPVATAAPGVTTGGGQVSGKNAAAAVSTNAANAMMMGIGKGSAGAGMSAGIGWFVAFLLGVL